MIEKLFSHLETASVSAICLTREGNLRFTNESFRNFLDYLGETDASKGKNFIDLFIQRMDSHWIPTFIDLLNSKENSCVFRTKIRDKNGTDFEAEFNFLKILEGNSVSFAGLIELDEKVQESIEERKRKVTIPREDRLFSLIHDLRNPLSAASSVADLLLQILPEEGRNTFLAQKIASNIRRTDRMIREFLTDLKWLAERKTELEKYELGVFVRQLIEDNYFTSSKRISIALPFPILCRLPRRKIEKILDNLISNAIKYSHRDSIVRITIEEIVGDIYLKVNSLGRILDAEEQSRIFDRFFQAKNTEGQQVPGWGLGLYLTQGIVESLDGKIRVESSKEQGTTFTVRIPIH
jgi:signal transduction histidine kinase